MTSIMVPCTCSSACQTDSTCARRPCFQAHLDAVQDARHPRIHRRAEACADHLGTMVVAMTTWAREQDLTDADLTVLAIEPPPCESYPRQRQQYDCAQTSGLVFSIIHLGEPKACQLTCALPPLAPTSKAPQPSRREPAVIGFCASGCQLPAKAGFERCSGLTFPGGSCDR
jgi:hypothetical protein